MSNFLTKLFTKTNAKSDTETGLFYSVGDEAVTSLNAQKISAVFACVNIKANALSVIPFQTYIRTKRGKEKYYSSLP